MATAPTKGNLKIAADNLKLSRSGYELLDKKRNILMREMMLLIDEAKDLQEKIDSTFRQAYSALIAANLELGIDNIEKNGLSVKTENNLKVGFRSIMGVEIPVVILKEERFMPSCGFKDSASSLDEAMLKFREVKRLTCQLAQVETSVFRLADNIKKAQKRANFLKNIMIPKFEEETKAIINALEEKEREEFSRLKMIKLYNEKTGL